MRDRTLVGVFVVLHGLVHGWFVVLSQGWVWIDDQMGWTGHSWLLSPVLSQGTILFAASVLYLAVTVGFVVAGIGMAVQRDWWAPLLVVTVVVSAVVIVALWDGRFDLLVEKGILGVVIDGGLVAYVYAVEDGRQPL